MAGDAGQGLVRATLARAKLAHRDGGGEHTALVSVDLSEREHGVPAKDDPTLDDAFVSIPQRNLSQLILVCALHLITCQDAHCGLIAVAAHPL